jgi:hypothetical protein
MKCRVTEYQSGWYISLPTPYYPLGTIGTVPRPYDLFKAYEGMERRKNEN